MNYIEIEKDISKLTSSHVRIFEKWKEIQLYQEDVLFIYIEEKSKMLFGYKEKGAKIKELPDVLSELRLISLEGKTIKNCIKSALEVFYKLDMTIINSVVGAEYKKILLNNLNLTKVIFSNFDEKYRCDFEELPKQTNTYFLNFHDAFSLAEYQKVNDFMFDPRKISKNIYEEMKYPIKNKIIENSEQSWKAENIGNEVVQTIKKRKSYRKYLKGQSQTVFNIIQSALGFSEGYIEESNKIQRRGYPSGGGLYSVDTYVYVLNDDENIKSGLYYYNYFASEMSYVKGADRKFLDSISAYKDALSTAEALIFFVADFSRVSWKYRERSYRLSILETGHMSQNVTLCAESIGYGTCCFLGYCDRIVDDFLNLDDCERSLYMMTIGRI